MRKPYELVGTSAMLIELKYGEQIEGSKIGGRRPAGKFLNFEMRSDRNLN